MLFIKKFLSLFSSTPVVAETTTPISPGEEEGLASLARAKAELALLQELTRQDAEKHRVDTERTIKMRQVYAELSSTYKVLDACDEMRDSIRESHEQVLHELEEATLSVVDFARKLEQERISKKLGRLQLRQAAPSIAPTVSTPTSAATVVPPVVTGTLPHSFNVSQKQ